MEGYDTIINIHVLFLGKQFDRLDEATEILVAIDYVDQLPSDICRKFYILYAYTESVVGL